MIEALEARGYQIGCIAGCSMGAVVGGIYAAGKLDEYREWTESLDYLDVLRLLDVSFRLGAIRGEKVFGKIHEIVGEIDIEQLAIPYTAVATDLTNQQEIWFQEGCLHKAMRASAAIPSLFTPVTQGLAHAGRRRPAQSAAHRAGVVSSHCDLIVAVNLNSLNQKQYSLPVIERPAAFKGKIDQLMGLAQRPSALPPPRYGRGRRRTSAHRDRQPLDRAEAAQGSRRQRAQVGQQLAGARQRRPGLAAGAGQPELRGHDEDLRWPSTRSPAIRRTS